MGPARGNPFHFKFRKATEWNLYIFTNAVINNLPYVPAEQPSHQLSDLTPARRATPCTALQSTDATAFTSA